jgi:hypothetical protein
MTIRFVASAVAGIKKNSTKTWIPAFAGMTKRTNTEQAYSSAYRFGFFS